MEKIRTEMAPDGTTTVPEPVKETLGLGDQGSLESVIENDSVMLRSPSSSPAPEPEFFRYFGSIKVGPGSVVDDIGRARHLRATQRLSGVKERG